MDISDLEPKALFRHFSELIKIPRGSGKEEKAREYVIGFAKQKGYKWLTDNAGNVVIRVPATPNYERCPCVVLQGHLDIVWEKQPSVSHNFETDPIPAYIDGDFIRTKGTTLGADNGIGVAAALAVADEECVHGPLELLFTVDEECGLTGAMNISKDMLEGKILLNLDSEEEGVFFIGCAGGGDTTISIPIERMAVPIDHVSVAIKVEGLRGGHSGLEINAGRGNAIKILARAITHAIDPDELLLVSFSGGNKRNAIPRDAQASLYINKNTVDKFASQITDFWRIVKEELGERDPNIKITVVLEPSNILPITRRQSGRIVRLLLGLPHGVLGMSQEIEGLVETSTNLAVVGTSETECTIVCNSRSSVKSCLDSVRESIKSIGKLAGGVVSCTGQYPGWRPNKQSPILAVATKVWRDYTGQEPKVTAIHAGLECGVIGERFPGMDMISFGPTMHGVHSPDETLSITSSARFYNYLKRLLEHIATKS